VTFSIVARSSDGSSWGVAVASKFLAVGSAVPAAQVRLGAIATQSYVNTLYKRDGLAHLAAGASAREALDALLGADEERDHRQVGIVDGDGRAATWTGPECLDWAGGVTGDGYAIQGNILTGEEVVEAMERAYLDAGDAGFPERLLTALMAGDRAGGDSRGRQSAALLVVSETGSYTPGDDLAYDLRVDDHPDPCPELARLLALHHGYFDRPREEDLLPLEGDLAREVRDHLAALGYPDLDTWAGVENYEARMVAGRVDPYVLERLRQQAGTAR